jgi:transposase
VAAAITADERHEEVAVAWSCAQRLRSVYQPNLAAGGRVAETVIASFPTCPIPEIAGLGRTLRQWRTAFLAYFDTGRESNGGTEAISRLIDLHRRVAEASVTATTTPYECSSSAAGGRP